MGISTARTVLLAATIGSAYMTWSMLIALPPTFYPTEAQAKGANPSQYGSVFGAAHLSAFFAAPFFVKFGTVGPKVTYYSGAFVQGVCAIAFGCLHYCHSTFVFLTLSYVLRILGGAADAAAMGAMLAILMKLYPGRTGQIVAWTGTASGLGHMAGPALGSFLYTVGGFTLPFFVVGSISLVPSFCLCLVIPDIDPDTVNNNNKAPASDRDLTFVSLLRHPSITLPFLSNLISISGVGLLESTLEPYLKNVLGASQMDVGISFLILGAFYVVSNPIAGWACDRVSQPAAVTVIGHFAMIILFTFIGPLPFVPFGPSLRLTQMMPGVFGLAYAPVKVSTFVRSQKAAVEAGFKDDIDTYSFISGMWTSSFFLGNFCGPFISGFLVERFGFRQSTLFFFGLNVAVFGLDLADWTIRAFGKNRKVQYFKYSKLDPNLA